VYHDAVDVVGDDSWADQEGGAAEALQLRLAEEAAQTAAAEAALLPFEKVCLLCLQPHAPAVRHAALLLQPPPIQSASAQKPIQPILPAGTG
jgi:hypothetical protein